MKLCVNCKHYRRGFLGFNHFMGFGECHAPQNKIINPVTGETKLRTKFADIHRESTGGDLKLPNYCNDGDWFEEK